MSQLRLTRRRPSVGALVAALRGLAWLTESKRARPLITLESLVAYVITGVRDFELTAS